MKTKAIILLILVTIGAYAQKTTISGYVHDTEANDACIGATVYIKGSTTGTITDYNGNYTIKVSDGDTVCYSYTGYAEVLVIFSKDASKSLTEIQFSKKAKRFEDIPQTFITSSENIRIDMLPSSEYIEDIPIIAYTKIEPKDQTGATAAIKGSELMKRSTGSTLGAIEGKLTGIKLQKNSGTPGGDVTVNIRGISSLNNSSPLYVVDGVAMDDIKSVNPNDIETIAVLKDGSSCAIYGARGASGVIIIQTKGGLTNYKNRPPVFFKNIKNEIQVNSYDPNVANFEIQSKRGTVFQENGTYYFEPSFIGETSLEVVEKDEYGRIINVSTIPCQIKNLPKPAANFAGKQRGIIGTDLLDSIPDVLTLRYERDLEEPVHSISGFGLVVNNHPPLYSNSNKLTDEQKSILKMCKSGDVIKITDITLVQESGGTFKAHNIKLEIN